jgi:putative oxidoreductase
MNMATGVASKKRTIALWVFRVVLGLLFLAIGTTKLTGTWDTVPYFAAIGWGQWLRYLTGLLDVTGAVLLFVPRWTFYGALILTCTVGTATLIAVFRPALPLAIPLVFTLLAATLAWLARPRKIAVS